MRFWHIWFWTASCSPRASSVQPVEKSIYTQQYGLFLATLRAARETAGLLQSELAERLNVDQPFVSKCESGQRRLDFIEVREWCAAIGITLNELTDAFEQTMARAERK
ncbi:helix-turn-helix transcriptional regulator [Paraburkholderia strydomiana]